MAREQFRRMLVGGYDPAQVRAAIDERDERLKLLEREAQKLATRVIETERRLQRMLPGSGEDGVIGGLGRRIEDIHAQARGQATRIRMAALEDAVQISERVKELAKVRDELGQRVSELAGMAGIKLGAEEDRPPVGTEPAQASADGIFAGPVEVEVGPLKDFAQLTNFEDAASGIDSVEDVKVSRFADGRATFSMSFGQPVELLRELEERAPFEFKVRDTRGDGIVLDVDAEPPSDDENRAA